MKEKEKYEISPEGSLGLLALGAKGVEKWRKVRDQKAKDKGTEDE